MAETIADRFARETAEHEMTVLHDDGLYRHLRFRRPNRSCYWFELITIPGSLIFRGDGESFTFRRVEDMLKFFRGPVGRINPGYWAEKLTSGNRDNVMKYDREIFEAEVKREFVDAVRDRRAPAGLGRAVRRDILDATDEAWSEEGARRLLLDFAFYVDERNRHSRSEWVDGELTWVPAQRPDFEFSDVWEWQLCDYDWWFLWSLHAIVWGIARYDSAARAAGRPDAARAQDVTSVVAPGGVL